MNILIVEDDFTQALFQRELLEKAFPSAEISHIKTESAFRAWLTSVNNSPPDVVIMDMMIRWGDPPLDVSSIPDDVARDGFYRAGLRCQRLLAENSTTSDVPVIIYSVLARDDLRDDLKGTPRNVMYLSKDFDGRALVRMVRSCVQTELPARRAAKGRVFIGHGRSPLWARVQIFLEKELSLNAFSYESESHVGEPIVLVLEHMAEQADFAVLILTAEDETAVGARRARQNVIHEAGLFQGKLGFRKAVLLLQDGLEGFSNVEGLQAILFAGDRIDQTFFELQRVLKRENIL